MLLSKEEYILLVSLINLLTQYLMKINPHLSPLEKLTNVQLIVLSYLTKLI